MLGTQSALAATKPFTIVIDPGHGGADLGTVYNDGKTFTAEKNVTLVIAREAARQLRARGIRAVLTRDSDRDVPLASRTQLANRIGADLFLSIHMNSTATPMVNDAEGTETFILNNTTDASSRRLAHLENSVIGGNPNDSPEQLDVALILKDLRLDANLAGSKQLACLLQQKLVTGISASYRFSPALTHIRNRGVRQALFHVLLGADMPSALLEVGFLTNARDRSITAAPYGQRAIGRSIASAIEQFKLGRKTQGAAAVPAGGAAAVSCRIH